MILSVQPYKYTKPVTKPLAQKQNTCHISFKELSDEYLKSNGMYREDVDFFDGDKENQMFWRGILDDKKLDLTLEEYNPKQRKLVSVKGFYGDKEVDIKAHYEKEKKHHYKGTFGDKSFNLTFKEGGIFTDDKLKGQINGEEFIARFPSASAKDDNRDLIILLLELSGFTAFVRGHNFSVTDESNARYAYFKNGNGLKSPVNSFSFENKWYEMWKYVALYK